MTNIPVQAGELVALDYLNEVARAHWTKTSSKLVSTVAETDLLNGEFTVNAGALGSSRMVRVSMLGDNLGNNGSQAAPRFKVKFGGATILDTNVLASAWGANASRYGWRGVIEIANLGTANSQEVSLNLNFRVGNSGGVGAAFTTGSGSYFSHSFSSLPAYFSAAGVTAGTIDTTTAKLVEFTVTLPSGTATECNLIYAKMEVV